MDQQIALSSLESPDHALHKDHGWFACTWFLGRRCNYDCSYCSALEHDNHSGHVSLEVVKSMVAQLKTHIQNKHKKFKMSITGGEPFVHPKVLDIIHLIKQELDPQQFSFVTNGSVPLKKYKKAIELGLTHMTFSYHMERSDKERQKITDTIKAVNDIFKSKHNKKPKTMEDIKAMHDADTNVIVNLMMLPGKLNEVKHVMQDFEQHGIAYTIRDIEPNFTANGRMIRPYEPGYELTKHIKNDEAFRYKNRQDNVNKTNEQYYSKEERDFLESAMSKTNWNNVRVYNQDGSTEETHTDELIKHGRTNFRDWRCYVGIDHMYVDWDGRVWTALCRQGGVIGNISGKINFPQQPIKCWLDYCRCNINIWTRKYKEDTHRHLVTDEQ